MFSGWIFHGILYVFIGSLWALDPYELSGIKMNFMKTIEWFEGLINNIKSYDRQNFKITKMSLIEKICNHF